MTVYRDKKDKSKIIMEGTIRIGYYNYKKYRRVIPVRTLSEGRAYEKEFKETFDIEKDSVSHAVITFEDLIKEYNRRKNRQIKSSTKQSNLYISKLFSELFDKKVGLVTTKDIEKILDDLYNKKYAVSYVNKALNYIKKVYRFATDEELVLRNPAQKIKEYKRPDELKKEMNFYTADEFNRFIKCFPRNRENGDYFCYMVINFLYFLGLRLGECLALRPKDIDLEKRTVRIDKTIFWHVEGHSFIVTPPKTENSNRTILIPNHLMELLTDYLEWFNNFYNVTDDCFLFGIDRPILPKSIRKRMKKACELSGVKEIRIHDFRHSHASLLANSGLPISAIAKRLGHTVNECQRTYIHLFESTETALVDAIDKQFDNLV